MNKDDIKKALESCVTYKNVDCNNCPCCPYDGQILCQDVLCKDALTLITEQEKEIERLKDENKENCWKCIEAKRVTEEDYAKLQEEFANYQIASDKEMIAQVKQAKIDVLNELIDKMFEREYMGVKYKERIFYESEINDMIAEVRNAEDKG